MLSSLIVTLARDPGPIKPLEALEEDRLNDNSEDSGEVDNEEMTLEEALFSHTHLERNASSRTDAQDPLIPLKANGERRWCRKCWAPKPERAHHCSECNRCVLKQDHHCPWLGNRCIVRRANYPSFVHFLLTCTLYAGFVFAVSVPPMKYYLLKPFVLDDHDMTPFHALTVVLLGAVFAISMGSFFSYHAYLVLTNQTTLESLTPYILLRHLPILPSPPSHSVESTGNGSHQSQENMDWARPPSSPPWSPGSTTTDDELNAAETYPPPPYTRGAVPLHRTHSRHVDEPYRFASPPSSSQVGNASHGEGRWQEHELNSKQRRLVREAARNIRIYDLGWRENLRQALDNGDSSTTPGRRKTRGSAVWIWVERVFWGGRPLGDSASFRHNRHAEQQLRQLAEKLAAASISSL
ncbi:hypothetical protein BS47DRAFT_1352375 [Hydnum rufescens UP504]|uniref:Palmitoyltransferase n=1 Tax=Hydnum rufescens UP504 TaxID=1448309 RepID=A0A9P6AL91_9AGAM|nr:hypothetical protein BS47DRAFT_1352375 [Hydnum rufescens UP504]